MPDHTGNLLSVVEIEQLLIQQYNTISECYNEEKEEMSLEDKQFIQLVQSMTKSENGHYCL